MRQEAAEVIRAPIVLAQEAIHAIPDLPGMVGDKIKENHMGQPSLIGELFSLGRECMKEAGSTVLEIGFGKPGGMHEPGTPLAPTQAMVTESLTGQMPRSLDDLRTQAQENAARASQEMGKSSLERDNGRSM